jgi:hypothetical protein
MAIIGPQLSATGVPVDDRESREHETSFYTLSLSAGTAIAGAGSGAGSGAGTVGGVGATDSSSGDSPGLW